LLLGCHDEPGVDMNERILISGASIAGSTVAFWLARHGLSPTVIERAPGLRTGGNGVDVRGQAVEVAEQMGIMAQIRAAATDVIGTSFVDATNRSVARIDMQAIQRKYGSGEVEIMRGDLVAILHEATGDDVEYVFKDSIRTLQQDGDGVTVTFESGATRRFDLVIGADGMHSAVRRLVFGPEEWYLRYLQHYFAFAAADPALGADRWMTIYNLPGKMAGVYRSGNHTGAKAYLMFRQPEPLAYDHSDIEQHKRLLDEAYADVSSWHVPQLLAGVLADPELYFDSLSQVNMPSWSSRRVTLVGDAAHCASPVSGSGAMLAMIGAYRLAGELSARPGDHVAAFARYEEGHRPLVERSQANLFTGIIAPKTRARIWARNTMARLPLANAMAGLERRLQPKTERLPNYLRSREETRDRRRGVPELRRRDRRE
jgi:2-polyprenyl-6-methoxyphenol hydroxylase-like FAD-dependent oxidoreductase